MRPEYQTNTNLGALLGILLQVAGNVVARRDALGPASPIVGVVLALVGTAALIWGCCNYAKGKGYPWPLGFLGLLSCIGLLVLALLPDKDP